MKRNSTIYNRIILSFLFIFSFYSSSTAKEEGFFLLPEKLILIPIDYSNFFCSLCLDSFLAFSKEFVSKNMQRSVIWIIVFKEGGNSENIKILEKKLRGLFKTHNINFPIVVDMRGIFKKSEEETKIILIDTSNKIVKEYKYPLSLMEKKEIFMTDNKHRK